MVTFSFDPKSAFVERAARLVQVVFTPEIACYLPPDAVIKSRRIGKRWGVWPGKLYPMMPRGVFISLYPANQLPYCPIWSLNTVNT